MFKQWPIIIQIVYVTVHEAKVFSRLSTLSCLCVSSEVIVVSVSSYLLQQHIFYLPCIHISYAFPMLSCILLPHCSTGRESPYEFILSLYLC